MYFTYCVHLFGIIEVIDCKNVQSENLYKNSISSSYNRLKNENSRKSVNNEFDRMWNETFGLHFEALPWYLSGRADYNQAVPQKKKLQNDSKNPDRYSLLLARKS
jgi:hypothetical protein